MAVKLEIIKKFYSGSESKLSNVDESFHSAFENMLDLNEIISFDAVDVDDTTGLDRDRDAEDGGVTITLSFPEVVGFTSLCVCGVIVTTVIRIMW